jgi:beta-galactosidase
VTTGRVWGTYADGSCAVIENTFGKGRTLLVGTFPSVGYADSNGAESAAYFSKVLAWSGVKPQISVSTPVVTARLHKSAEYTYLWALNASAQDQQVSIRISPELGKFTFAKALWGSFEGKLVDNKLDAEIPAQDGLILQLT